VAWAERQEECDLMSLLQVKWFRDLTAKETFFGNEAENYP